MANFTQIQTLKAKIPCSTKQALYLLKQSNGDIEKTVEVYHQNSITDIIMHTNCNKEMAEKYYDFFHQDKEKAIKKIQELQTYDEFIHKIITTRDDKQSYREPGFSFYIKAKKDEVWSIYDNVSDYIFIPAPDCWLISEILSKYCDDYDPYFHNDFTHEAILNVIHDLSLLTDDDKKVMQFYQEMIAWLKEKSKPDNIIQMYSNI